MEEKNYGGIVPEQKKGEVVDVVHSVELADNNEAESFFVIVKERLLNVNFWHKIAGMLTANFQLTDKDGNDVSRLVEKGDYFKINIPGPGSLAGGGYDWVHVEGLTMFSEAEVEHVGIRVRPAPNPQKGSKEVAHFYSDDSTSSFTAIREGNKVTAGIYDRNIKPNKDAGLVNKARDAVVSLGGIAGLSELQWNSLTKGFLEKEA